MEENIHNYARRLSQSLKRLDNSEIISQENKSKIKEFHLNCVAEGLSTGRTERYVYILKHIAELMKKDFISTDKGDIISLMQEIESMQYKAWTKQLYRVTLKKFYTWLRQSKECPDEVNWLRSSVKINETKLPEELLTPEDIKNMIEKANNPRDKALISLLYESGCRIGEIAMLRIRAVAFDKYGAVVSVSGKTGSRRVRLINSVPYIALWIAQHPQREDPSAYIWLNFNFKKEYRPVQYGLLCKLIKQIAREAGIKKRIYPHLFRHSRATYLANFMTEAQMKNYFGWVQASKMASIYVHLSGKEVDEVLLKINGVKIDETEKSIDREALKPKTCVRCSVVNPATGKFCQRCGMALELKAIIESEDERKKADETMNKLVKDPEVLALLQKKLEFMQAGEIHG